jgi:UPF0755 protein
MKKLILISIIGVFVLTLLGAVLVWNNFVNQSASAVSEEVIYEVAPGQTFRMVAKNLERQGVIRNADLFIIFARLRGEGNKMKVGEYLLNKNMRPSDVIAVLVSGKSIEYKLTIAEGLSIYEIADLFAAAKLCSREDFLKLVTDKSVVAKLTGAEHTSLEGFLFPETYSYTRFTDYRDLVNQMAEKHKQMFAEVMTASKINNLNPFEALVLSSIVEKETGAPAERPLIASVFHNRLHKGMMLQTDPTIIYGKAVETGHIEINITRADLTRPTPYNTYTFKGLPPGPICNPGREAMLAAVQPATSNYLYFVSHNDGTHQFSEDYKAHLKAVQTFQLDPKAREGKSWRDLNKSTQ